MKAKNMTATWAADLARVTSQIQQKKAHVDRLRTTLAAAEARLAELEEQKRQMTGGKPRRDRGELRARVLRFFRAENAIGLLDDGTDPSRTSLRRTVGHMADAGLLRRVRHGVYVTTDAGLALISADAMQPDEAAE